MEARGERSTTKEYDHTGVYPATIENCPALASGMLGSLLSSPSFVSSTEGDIRTILNGPGHIHEGRHGRFLVWNMPLAHDRDLIPGRPQDNAVYLTIQHMFGEEKAVHIGTRTSSVYAFHAIADTLLAFERYRREERWSCG